MTPYVRFCSCQLNAANMIQKKTENDKKFAEVHKVGVINNEIMTTNKIIFENVNGHMKLFGVLFQFMKRCWMDTRTKGMPLSSFLLKPMQRITKYPLLIDKVSNCVILILWLML